MVLIHRCPPNGSGLTPCCAKTLFELNEADQITTEDRLVTCGRPTILPMFTSKELFKMSNLVNLRLRYQEKRPRDNRSEIVLLRGISAKLEQMQNAR